MGISDIFTKFGSYVKNAGLYFASSLFVAFIGLLLNPILAKNLSPTDYAITGYYSSFNLLLIPLLHFCTMTYYSRQYYFIEEEKRAKLGNTILLSMNIIGFFSLLAFSVIFYFINIHFGQRDLPFIPYAILTFTQLYIANNTTFYLTKLRICRKAKKYAIFSIIQCIVSNSLVVLLVVYFKEGALGKLCALLISSICFALYSFTHSLTKWELDKTILKSALKFGAPLTVSALFWYCLTGIDRLFLGQTGDIEQLGIYNVGVSIAAYMQIVFTTLNSTFEPDIYQSIAQRQYQKLFAITATIIGTVAICNLVFIIFSPFLIDLLTAGRYVSSTVFVRIISLANIAMACYYIVVYIIIGKGYVKGELFVRITGASLSIFTYWLLIKKFNFYGAAWGQVMSFTMLTIIGLLFLLIKKRRSSSNN